MKRKTNALAAQTLQLTRGPDESKEASIAKACINPAINAAKVISEGHFGFAGAEIDFTSMVTCLSDEVNAVQLGKLQRSEELLITQAHTLDALFRQLALRSQANSREGYLQASDTYMRLALRAQNQCRATLETLSVVKNPPSVAFVRQANIANGPQQINNGFPQTDEPSRARKFENAPNGLMEQQNGKRLECATADHASGAHPTMETVAAVDGTQND